VLDNLTNTLTADNWSDTLLSSDNIPAVMTTKQIANGLTDIIKGTYQKEPKVIVRGVEQASPVAIKDLLKFERTVREGYKTTKGKTLVTRSNLTKAEEALLGLTGATPEPVIDKMEEIK